MYEMVEHYLSKWLHQIFLWVAKCLLVGEWGDAYQGEQLDVL